MGWSSRSKNQKLKSGSKRRIICPSGAINPAPARKKVALSSVVIIFEAGAGPSRAAKVALTTQLLEHVRLHHFVV